MILAAYGMTGIAVTIATAKRTHQDCIIRKTHLRLIRAEQTTEQTTDAAVCRTAAAKTIEQTESRTRNTETETRARYTLCRKFCHKIHLCFIKSDGVHPDLLTSLYRKIAQISIRKHGHFRVIFAQKT
jgi:hypothetical protein